MRRSINYYRMMWVRHDLPAGFSVFLVALPLCLGIALASGTPAYAGLVSGIVGGILVSVISGSQMSVSGPAAGLTTVVAAAIASSGDYSVFLSSVVVAGIFQVLLGVLRLGGIAGYFPSAVIKGMLAAIGIILISKQIPVSLGHDEPGFWSTTFLNFLEGNKFAETLRREVSASSVAITLVSLVILFVMNRRLKKIALLPASLAVVIAAVSLAWLLGEFSPALALRAPQLVEVPFDLFESLTFPDLQALWQSPEVWKNGLTIGVLATLETLLCVEAVDKLDVHKRVTPVNRELIAQGAGNLVCGLIGGIPITAVVVRGAANVDAGARTKMSAFTHGVFLLLSVLFVPALLNLIPYAALAAILLVTGYNLTRPRLYGHMWKLGWKQFLPFILTIALILFTDLLVGVSIGLLMSVYFIIQNNFSAEYRIVTRKEHETPVNYIKLNSNVTFLNKVKLKRALDKLPRFSTVTIDGSECNFIDYDILEIISEFRVKAHDRHIEVKLLGIETVDVKGLH